ncbi:unnamed protein product [Linum tenue]|uniref:RNase H type-1 domain-containing protein n=1 Tax=Linum tenue TaxID=586396 RepID=A0AAV0LMJ5_9ROSI|nr:unnamed protein product [Linum tenue]CAI0491047.1 unnamed protein product [Linum tenue]
MTNCERKRRKLTSVDTCELCKLAPETTEHILRHCPHTQQVWRILNLSDNVLNVGLCFADWLAAKLKDADSGLLFGVAAWYLWKRRNEYIFQQKQTNDQVLGQRIRSWANTIKQAQENDKQVHQTTTTKTLRQLHWTPPPTGWVCVNTDGSVRQPESKAAAGGLIRDELGRCRGAFTANLGVCTITRAELVGAIHGLKMAWDQGHKKVQLLLDSITAIRILSAGEKQNQRYYNITRQFQELINRNWEVQVSHTYRECNRAADFLANKGHEVSVGNHIVSSSDSGLSFWILYDSMGIAQDRLI